MMNIKKYQNEMQKTVIEPVFKSDKFITRGVLIILGTIIILLLVLELFGYVHRKMEPFQDQNNNNKTNLDIEFEKLQDERQIQQNIFEKEIAEIGINQQNKEDYIIPKSFGYYNEKKIKENDKGILKDIQQPNNILSGIYEIDNSQIEELLNIIQKSGIQFMYKDFKISQDLLLIKKYIFNRFTLELISFINKLMIENDFITPNHPYQFYKITNISINNNDFNMEKNDSLLKYPPTFNPFIQESLPDDLKDKIIKKLENQNKNIEPEPTFTQQENIKSYDEILKELLNKLYDEENKQNKKIEEKKSLKHLQGKTYDENDISNFNLDNNKLFIEIGREGTFQKFVIYANITIESNITNKINQIDNSISNEQINIVFNTLKLFSNKQPEGLSFIKEDNMNGIKLDGVFTTELNTTKNNSKWDLSKNYDMDNKFFNREYKENEINKHINKLSHDEWVNKHKCFIFKNNKNIELDQYNNQLFCESYHPEYQQNGVWDGPCQIDDECPFFEANKNYHNKLGGCDKLTGMCQMPIGIKRVGFKKYNKDKPFCYNCSPEYYEKNKNNNCCEEQQKKIDANINLDNINKMITPDYAFPGDIPIRNKQVKKLKQNNCLFNTFI